MRIFTSVPPYSKDTDLSSPAQPLLTGSLFVTAARSYIGTPFYHAGRSPYGLDCVGLLVCAAQDIGLPVSDFRNYTSAYVDPEVLGEHLARYCDSVEFGPIEDGDIGVFSIAGNPQHCAILTASGQMIHAYQSAGKVVEHPLDHHWRKRLAAVYRVRGYSLTSSEAIAS